MGAAGADTARAARGAPQHEQSLTRGVRLLRSTKLPDSFNCSLLAGSGMAAQRLPPRLGEMGWPGMGEEQGKGGNAEKKALARDGITETADRENPNLALSTLPLTEQPSPFPTRKAGGVHQVRSSPCSDPSGVLTSKKNNKKKRDVLKILLTVHF